MALPRLAPRLAISLPLSGLFLAARAAGQEVLAAALAAALIGAMATPTRRAGGIAAMAIAAGVATGLWVARPGAAGLLPAAVPLAGNLLLAWHFGATLRPGREPLIARYTRADIGPLCPALRAYTRGLTLLWTGVFLAFAAANAATLSGFGPPPGPTAALNIGLSLLVFLGEHPLRRALFPALGPARPWNTLRAIRRAGAVPDAR